MRKSVRVASVAMAIGVAAVLGGSGAQAVPGDAPGAHDRAATQGLVAQIRQAVDPYTDVEVAIGDGYVPVSGCEVSDEGGMGIHYLNPALAGSFEVDPAHPTILLYGPDGEGGLRLLGAEWWQANIGQERPQLGGQPFDGPMPGHGPDMPEHYDLHVWTHVANPAGVFAPWNARVTC
ncbi:hypothetical protein [Intrasporangium sp.]|uniref:hypothetical protein n=1 Tax=Intrasporangium sp. TaxID=1925024 RepID=UPI002939F192|nr:hypothetical protein [Intrasporangium sp.]MDV3222488.1 hypothetical protein [Intrasporangium sp.]